ncbi:TPA: MBL fold metallo-hydrolase [Candidatus Bathyarchaeota archaeon]|nr:MBL fold metallo-hydrolase [Candidatus Bathyarchaeota archaeon]
MEIAKGIHLIKCPWSTYFVSSCAIIGDTITLVDAGASDSPEAAIYPYLKDIGRDPSEISHIILTHAHLDHCGGVASIKKKTGCKVYVHKLGKLYLEDAGLIDKELHDRFPAVYPEKKPDFESVKADVTFENGDILDLGGQQIRVLHTPGHSPGSSCLIDEEQGVYISGDSIQGRGERRPLLFYSSKEYVESMRRLLKESVKVLIMGHPFPPFNDAVLKGENAVKHIRESLKGIEELKDLLWKVLEELRKPLSIKQIQEKVGVSQPVTVECVLEEFEREKKTERIKVEGDYLWALKK